MYKKVLVPMALDHGISPQTLEIAQALCGDGGEIKALHVYELPSGSVGAYLDETVVQNAFTHAEETMREKLVALDGVSGEVIKGHSARSIVDYANANGVDCIVMGSHKPGLSDYFIGSTASRVVRHATCAVHIVRG